jgi:hypothetical protein
MGHSRLEPNFALRPARFIAIYQPEEIISGYPLMGIRSMIMGRTGRYMTLATHDHENGPGVSGPEGSPRPL